MSSPTRESRADHSGFGDFFRYHGWLSPGVRLFRKLSFTSKAVWISAAFIAPLLMMVWLVWSSAQSTIDSTRHEQQGLRYLKPVFELVDAAQERRRAAVTGAADMAEAQAKVDAAWAQVQAVHRLEGPGLAADQAFAAVQESQAALKQNPLGADADATFDMHSKFIDHVMALIDDVADGSELSLDPELDTYQMTMLAVQRGPELAATLARLRDVGATVLKSGERTPERHERLSEGIGAQPLLSADVERAYRQGIAGLPELAKRLDRGDATSAERSFVKAVREQILGQTVVGNVEDYRKLGDDAVAKTNDFNAKVRVQLEQRLQQRIDQQRAAQYTELGVVAAFVLLALYLMVAFYKVMMGGLQEVSGHLREITRGNLTTAPRPWGSDEAAQLMLTLGEMQAALRRIASTVLDGSAQVKNSSGEIAGAAHDLSGRTEQAAANLQQTAATMEQMSGQVQQTGGTVAGAARIVQDNAGAAASCGRVIGDVVNTMDGIRQSSNRIGEIIGTIDGIAFQTNILALNAAVEAARAGEHGRGFAVVASEVRALAQRSAQAAKEIKTLIGASIEQVESGHEVVVKAREMMATIVSNAEHMATMMSEITATTQQQGQGVVEVGQAVRSLDESTQQNAALVEQTSAAASALAEQAERLSVEIAFFKLA